MPLELETVEQANQLIMQIGLILKNFKAENIRKMIGQYDIAESASVVFDAMALEGTPSPKGRTEYWNNVAFNKRILELALPLIEFLNIEEKNFQEKRIANSAK